MLVAKISITLQNLNNHSLQKVFQADWLERSFQNMTLENILEMMTRQNGSTFLSILNTTSTFAPNFIENVNQTLNQNSTNITFTGANRVHSNDLGLFQIFIGLLSIFIPLNFHRH